MLVVDIEQRDVSIGVPCNLNNVVETPMSTSQTSIFLKNHARSDCQERDVSRVNCLIDANKMVLANIVGLTIEETKGCPVVRRRELVRGAVPSSLSSIHLADLIEK